MAFLQLVKDFVAKLKLAQAKLPPADQFDANSTFRWAITNLGDAAEEADLLYGQAETALNEMKTAGMAEGKTAGLAEGKVAGFAEGKEAGVTEGKTAAMAEIKDTHIPKADHDTLVKTAAEQAAKTGREAAEADFNARLAAQAERAKIATETGLPAAALEKVADAQLAAATAEATRKILTERVAALTAIEFNPADHASIFASVAEDLTPEGATRFAARIEDFKLAKSVGANAGKKVGAAAEAKKSAPDALKLAGGGGGAPAAKPEGTPGDDDRIQL